MKNKQKSNNEHRSINEKFILRAIDNGYSFEEIFSAETLVMEDKTAQEAYELFSMGYPDEDILNKILR